MIREDFIPDCGLTIARLAKELGVSRQSVNELVRERRAVSPEMALRLSRFFGNSAEFWLNAQREVDLWDAARKAGEDLERIRAARITQRVPLGRAPPPYARRPSRSPR
jgi:addiction module HigA family antidote